MKRYRIVLQNDPKSLVMQHKNNGQEQEKLIGQMSEFEQAKRHAYFVDGEDSNLAIPALYVIGCVRDFMIKNAPSKTKKRAEWEYSSCFLIEPDLIDVGFKLTEDLVDKRTVPIKKMGSIASSADVIRPKFPFKIEFILNSILDMSTKDLRTNFEDAGMRQGLGSANKLGYGRFIVLEFVEIK